MSSLCSFRLDKRTDDRTLDLLIVFLAADEMREGELSSLVTREVQASLAPDEIILITRRTALATAVEKLKNSPDLEGMRNRLGRSAITVIGFGADGSQTTREMIRPGDCQSGITLAEVGRRCVAKMFKQHGGFVEANRNYHFTNPSQRHTDRFIRLSNLLVSSAEISLLAMTALPLLSSDSEVVHVDTPAMFAVVAALNDHLRKIATSRPWLRCENFRSYFGIYGHDFLSGGEPAVLISASSSGSLAKQVAERGVPRNRIGHILYLGKEDATIRAAVSLAYDEDNNPEGIREERETYEKGRCALCDAGSIAVPLQGDQFDLGGPDFEPLTMRKDDAPKGLSALMGRLAASESFRVSTKRVANAKQFQIDAAALLANPKFGERADYLARRHIPSTTCECILLDADSKPFAARLFDEAGVSPRILEKDELDTLSSDDSRDGRALNGMPIVIVAAVIESGRSLRDVSRDLRRARPKSPQIYLVGCAKSASPSHRDELEKTLIQTQFAAKHAFATVEDIILPPAGTPNAWLAEVDFLKTARRAGVNLGETLEDRLARLEKSSVPLDELFLAVGDAPLRIQAGFVFWPQQTSVTKEKPASQADVFYTISSVLQTLRTNPPRPDGRILRANWFQQTRLDPANLGRFNDGVIQASILRAARPVEIDYSVEDDFARGAGRTLCRILDAASFPRGEAACEVLLALGSRRLLLPEEEMRRVLVERSGTPPLVAHLTEICRSILL